MKASPKLAKLWSAVRGVCYYCGTVTRLGGHNRPEAATIDHVLPRAKGGPDEAWNLRLACRSCNLKKSDVLSPGDIDLIRVFAPNALLDLGLELPKSDEEVA